MESRCSFVLGKGEACTTIVAVGRALASDEGPNVAG